MASTVGIQNSIFNMQCVGRVTIPVRRVELLMRQELFTARNVQKAKILRIYAMVMGTRGPVLNLSLMDLTTIEVGDINKYKW